MLRFDDSGRGDHTHPQRAENRNPTVNHDAISYRGHTVVDPQRKEIGTISDVVFDAEGAPTWAVVEMGLLHAEHYLPVAPGYMSESGEFVVPFDKRQVKTAPKADKNHFVDASTESKLNRHYELV